jgi:hypothetical protein
MSNDTLYFDEFFTLPSESKWSADFVTIYLSLPENTTLFFENSSEKLFRGRINISRPGNDNDYYSRTDYNTEPWELGNKFWVLTEDGLEETERKISKRK